MYSDYLKERYNETDFNHEEFQNLDAKYAEVGIKTINTMHGFLTYKIEGDAIVITDIYVKPQYRDHKAAWFLHDLAMERANKAGCRVAIGFSEKAGKKHELGKQALHTAGFKKYLETSTSDVYIKGI